MENDSIGRVAETMVEPGENNIRLDFYLRNRFSYRSRSEWQKSIADGEILINGKKTKSSHLLHAGEKIAFVPKPYEEPPIDPSFTVLEENDDYIAVSKSGNLPCHPAGVFFKHTLWFLLREKFGENIHIATRLDRETSGVVLAARSSENAASFTRALTQGRVMKTYLAMVYGDFPEQPVHAAGFLSYDPASPIRKKRRFTYESVPDGESASTEFRLLRKNGILSAVEAKPLTGRLHQIRATLFSLGFPMVGDKLYGPDDTLFQKFISDSLTEEDRVKLILPRQALHASSLELVFRGRTLHFDAPLPPDMDSLRLFDS